MVEMNLLPWREYRKRWQQKQLKKMLITLVVCIIFLSSLIHYLFLVKKEKICTKLARLSLQLEDNPFPISDTKSVFTPFTQTIHDDQIFMKELFIAMTTLSINITSIKTKKNNIIFTGTTDSLSQLSDFLLHWPGVKLFSAISFDDMAIIPHTSLFSFRLIALKNSKENEDV